MKILIYAGYKNHPSSEEGKKEKKKMCDDCLCAP
jgi:hypothetical protein